MTPIPPTDVGKPSDYPEVLSSEEIRTRFLKVLGPTDAPTVPLNLRVTDIGSFPIKSRLPPGFVTLFHTHGSTAPRADSQPELCSRHKT